jgi:hypothetical protein
MTTNSLHMTKSCTGAPGDIHITSLTAHSPVIAGMSLPKVLCTFSSLYLTVRGRRRQGFPARCSMLLFQRWFSEKDGGLRGIFGDLDNVYWIFKCTSHFRSSLFQISIWLPSVFLYNYFKFIFCVLHWLFQYCWVFICVVLLFIFAFVHALFHFINYSYNHLINFLSVISSSSLFFVHVKGG